MNMEILFRKQDAFNGISVEKHSLFGREDYYQIVINGRGYYISKKEMQEFIANYNKSENTTQGTKRSIVQITGAGNNKVFALADDGTVWVGHDTMPGYPANWDKKMPNLPDKE